jgi:hypothetical protein
MIGRSDKGKREGEGCWGVACGAIKQVLHVISTQGQTAPGSRGRWRERVSAVGSIYLILLLGEVKIGTQSYF